MVPLPAAAPPDEAVAPEPPAAARRAVRRRKVTFLGIAVVLVCVLVGYVLLAAGRPHEGAGRAPGSTAGTAPAAEPPPGGPGALAAPPAPPGLRTPQLGIHAGTTADLDRFVAVTGTRPEVVDVFESWSLGRPLPLAVADAVAAHGARLSITWEPWDGAVDTADQPAYGLAAIVAGVHDRYIDLFAESVGQYRSPVTIRLMHEMNGSWYPWGSGVNGNQPGEFVRAWQHVHDRFAALGVTNVSWMWAPNALYPGSAPLAELYPGDDYVDLVGVSNYNWGDRVRDGHATSWRSFDELFDPTIAELGLLTSRPLWIAEVASSNEGGSKAAWLADLAGELRERPRIAGVVWFSQLDRRRGVDWRIDVEPDAVQAWRGVVTSRLVIERNGR